MSAACGDDTVAPSVGATALNGSRDDLGIYWIDGEVQYVESVTDNGGMYAGNGVGGSVDRPSVGSTRIDGCVDVDRNILLSVHSQRHHQGSQKEKEYSFFHLAD